MRRLIAALMALVSFLSAGAYRYTYSFNATPISEAIVRISKDHPEINITFIYKELDNYRTSARVRSDDPYDALRQAVGFNPISVIKKSDNFYIEALQHGRYQYAGRAVGSDNEPVAEAVVMLLSPSDSTVISFGTTDASGRFSVPCDKEGVIGKISCLGYKTVVMPFRSFAVGKIVMAEKAVALGEVKVEADNAILYSDKSVYIPTSRQKNSAQTGGELLNRMAIPQLRINHGSSVETASGQSVDIFVDYLPATQQDLDGMKTSDVRRVEYYDYPADPRFQGKRHVINFIMQSYEYGGYVKGFGRENLLSHDTGSGQANGYAKLQYRKMTYDVGVGAYYMNSHHNGTEQTEVFRLPQPDGTLDVFERISSLSDSYLRRYDCWASVKALYKTEKTSMSNMASLSMDDRPESRQSGRVSYSSDAFRSGSYAIRANSRVNAFAYNGNWTFNFGSGSTLVLNPYYAYSRTSQQSVYDEAGQLSYANGAKDNTQHAKLHANYSHKLGKAGTLSANFLFLYYTSETEYSGTSSLKDRAHTYRLGPGMMYNAQFGKLYSYAGLGLHWDRSVYGDITETSAAPWADLSLQYALDDRNSVGLEFHFHESIPSTSYRSSSVVQSNPLMSYTGNPELRPYKCFDLGVTYTLVPSNRYSLSLYASGWALQDRYVYDYQATSTGILRTIQQPMGSYAQGQYGVYGSVRQFDGKLQIAGSLTHYIAHNGAPYGWTRSFVNLGLRAYFYLGKFNFGASYISQNGYADGSMVGSWMRTRDHYSAEAGWADASWNVRLYVRDFARWGWTDSTLSMQSRYYDFRRRDIGTGSHALVQLSATYTFGFGKKVERGNEAYQASGVSSGILK